MKRKITMTIMLVLSLSTMLWPWFSNGQGSHEVYGLIMLDNPIALTCIILAFVGIWTNFGKNSDIIGSIGLIGIMVMEIYEFLTWHILTMTGHFDLGLSIQLSNPEFYYAFFSLIMTYTIYKITKEKFDLTQ